MAKPINKFSTGKFSDKQIAELKKKMAGVNKIDPASADYKRMVALLNSLDIDKLEQLAGAKIKFISRMALMRYNMKKREKKESVVSEERVSTIPIPAKVKKDILDGKYKVVSQTPSKFGGKSVFTVFEIPNASSSQDKYVMALMSNPDRRQAVLGYYGTHPRADGALKFAKNHNLVESSETFAGCRVFTLDEEDYCNCIKGRKTYERWNRILDMQNEVHSAIREYAHRNPGKPIVVKNAKTGEMVYLKKD